jgi:DNA-binding NarL/FixJ family response regulator
MRVYIADEHDTVRAALADRLSRAANMEVIGHNGAADVIVREVRATKPDLVLVEVKRSDGKGLELLQQLIAMPCEPCVVVLTSYTSMWEEEAVSRAGAKLYLLKDIDSGELIRHLSDLTVG